MTLIKFQAVNFELVFSQLVIDPDHSGLRKKAKIYMMDMWNILDVLSIVLFVIGLALRYVSFLPDNPSKPFTSMLNHHSHLLIFIYFRLTVKLFYAGKVILCVDFIVFCLRLMAIFTISRTLGPKIIIVRRMVRHQRLHLTNADVNVRTTVVHTDAYGINVCPPADGYVLLHVPAEYLGGSVRRGQTRHPHWQWKSTGLDSPRCGLWTIPHHIRGFPHKYWL